MAALAVPLALLLTGVASAPATAAPVADPTPGSSGGGDPYFPLYGNGGYDVTRYGLDVRYDPKTRRLDGTARVSLTATQSLSRLNLDLVGLTVRSVTVDAKAATWSRSLGHELTVTPATPIAANAKVLLVVRYDGKPSRAQDDQLGAVGFLPTPDGALQVGQPESAAFWFPVDDHPQDKALYTIRLTVPKGLQAVSNGLPSATRVRGGWATTTWRPQHPMASYLAFMAVGKFTVTTGETSTGVPIINAVDPALDPALRASIDASLAKQSDILAAESGWFGPYPFEAAGGVVDDVDLGFALETQTRPVYSPAFWSFGDDQAYSDLVVVHELAHQWFGDSVSLHRWSDIWLNEGFASYAEWLWSERGQPYTTREIARAAYLQFPEKSEFWTVKPGDPGPDAVFDGAVYTRGALTLAALRDEVGDDTFFTLLRRWAADHRDGNGTTAEFVALAEQLSGRSLDAFFTAWLYTSGRPLWLNPSGARTATATAAQGRADAFARGWRRNLEHRLEVRR